MYDFVGVLAVDTVLTSFQQGSGSPSSCSDATDCANMDVDDAFREEHLAHEPPTSMVPRLHAICFRTVAPGALQCYPAGIQRTANTLGGTAGRGCSGESRPGRGLNLLAYPKSDAQAQRVLAGLAKAPSSSNASGSPGSCSTATANTDIEATGQVLALLTSALGGDKLAAEYLLLNLISRVYARVDGVALGLMSLALSHAAGVGTSQRPHSSRAEADLHQLLRHSVSSSHSWSRAPQNCLFL